MEQDGAAAPVPGTCSGMEQHPRCPSSGLATSSPPCQGFCAPGSLAGNGRGARRALVCLGMVCVRWARDVLRGSSGEQRML